MRLDHKGGDYYPRCDFRLEVKWGKHESESSAADTARAVAAALRAIAGVTTKTNYGTVPPVAVALAPALEKDMTAREATLGQIIEALDGLGVKYSPLPIIDLLTEPYRTRHAWRDRDVLWALGPDPARFDHLQALRLPSLAPFLTGARAVSDPEAFNEFHTGLDAYEQALLRYLAKEGPVLVPAPCPDGCHRSWMEVPAAALVARGWLSPRPLTARQLAAGPKLASLNKAELLAD